MNASANTVVKAHFARINGDSHTADLLDALAKEQHVGTTFPEISTMDPGTDGVVADQGKFAGRTFRVLAKGSTGAVRVQWTTRDLGRTRFGAVGIVRPSLKVKAL